MKLIAGALVGALALLLLAPGTPSPEEQLWQHRNLGKAFYENPATQVQAVDEFRKALNLEPKSARERLNYGLALLRAGKTEEGVAELQAVQKQDPKLPHTWFNLGIAYKQRGDQERALEQFQQMVKLVPDDPVAHYNLGVLHRTAGDTAKAITEFETASRLDPTLAAPHFQLYNLYRQASRAEDARRELGVFQRLKKEQEGAAVPEDMNWNWYAEIYDPLDAVPEKRADLSPSFEDKVIAEGLAKNAGVTVLDMQADGKPDLAAWSQAGVRLVPGMEKAPGAVSLAPGDFNNDGFTDLAVLSSGGVTLYRNEKGVFQKDAQVSTQAYRKAVWLDYDHDYDLDLFLIGNKSVLLRNNGAAGFSDVSAEFPFQAGRAVDAIAFELLHDTPGFDLVVSYADRPGVLYRDRLGRRFEAATIPELAADAHSLRVLDANDDGSMDVASSSGLLLNRKGKLGRAAGRDVFVDGVVADLDLDGREDRARVSPDGKVHLLRNVTKMDGNWVGVRLTGVKNLKSAYLAKVEVKAGTNYEKAIYRGIPLTFRVGAAAQVDTVRITWPNGLVQNETRQPVNRVLDIKEAPRLAGSCPMIFTWNGRGFEFITDVLGVAPLGAASGDGSYFPVDHDEYVQIPAESLREHAGTYEIRMTEELREVTYLDQVRLIALDHPADVDVVTNEKFTGPPFPEFRLFGVPRRIPPVTARDRRGNDVLARVLRKDRTYADSFARDFSGRAETHHLDLDFGNAAAANRAVLVLSGWVDWADGSTFAASAQEGKPLNLPSLQVKDAAGRWQTVIEDMGIPAGKPKTIAVDLTGKFLSRSREVRIVTNLAVYWDEIFLSETNAPPEARLTDVAMSSADLRFRGFSKPLIDPQRRQPEAFDYSVVSPVSMWNPTRGLYTRYGEVKPLLADVDDRLTIMGSGDELRLTFAASGLPALPAGWRRDFLLFVDGWAKDGDASTAYSQTVEPLPFHGMSQYPYPVHERFPHPPSAAALATRPALRLMRPLAPADRH